MPRIGFNSYKKQAGIFKFEGENMKSTSLRSIIGTALILFVLVGSSQISAFGQEALLTDQTALYLLGNPPRSIVGVWITQVTRRNCATGDPIAPPSQVQFTFARGGTLLETIVPTIFRSEGNGIWKRGYAWNQYSYAVRFMRFNPAGAFVGSGVVRAAVTLDDTGDHYESTATSEILDASGNVLVSGCATSLSTRFSPE